MVHPDMETEMSDLAPTPFDSSAAKAREDPSAECLKHLKEVSSKIADRPTISAGKPAGNTILHGLASLQGTIMEWGTKPFSHPKVSFSLCSKEQLETRQ